MNFEKAKCFAVYHPRTRCYVNADSTMRRCRSLWDAPMHNVATADTLASFDPEYEIIPVCYDLPGGAA